MPYELVDLFGRHQELKNDRALEEARWRELARLLRPEDQEFDARERRERDGIDTYDSTPLYALDDFVGGLFSNSVNPAERWFELGLAQSTDPQLKDFSPVKHWLWQSSRIVQDSLAPQTSTFYSEAPAWMADMAAFGDGTLYQEDVPGRGIVDRAVAKGRVYIGRDAHGRIDTVHQEMPMTGRQVKGAWPNVPESLHNEARITVIHCVHPNDAYDPRYLGRANMRFTSTFASEDLRGWRVDGGYRELPYHFIEWDRRAGRTYARGPGHNALPDMNMLDEMQYSILKAAQYEAAPVWLTANDDIMTAADIEPDAVISGAISENGKELARIAQRDAQLNYPVALAEQTRMAIRRAFRFSLWTIAGRPQMTAAEFTGWQEEELKAAAPHLVRVQGGLSTFIMRRFRLLWDAGRIPEPPPELSGQALAIDFVSPFAKAQQLGRARAALQLATAALTLKELFPEVGDNLDGDAIVRVMHEGMSNEPALIRDPRAVEQRRGARAQQEQTMLRLAQAAQGSAIMAEVAHAKQASSLAAGRKP